MGTTKLIYSGLKTDIYAYCNPRGECLALDFIYSLDESSQSKIVRLLKEFAERGEIHNSEKFRLEKKPIFAFKSYQTRILCFFYPDAQKKRIVLTHGFLKKKNSLPKSELVKAQQIYVEVMNIK